MGGSRVGDMGSASPPPPPPPHTHTWNLQMATGLLKNSVTDRTAICEIRWLQKRLSGTLWRNIGIFWIHPWQHTVKPELKVTQSVLNVPYICITVKPVLNGHSEKDRNLFFQYQLSLNTGQKYYRMLQGEHSAILSTIIKLPFVIKISVSSFLSGVLHRFYCTMIVIHPLVARLMCTKVLPLVQFPLYTRCMYPANIWE